MSDNVFDGDGKALRHYIDKGVDLWNNRKFVKTKNAVEKAFVSISKYQESSGNYVETVKMALKMASIVMDYKGDLDSLKSKSDVSKLFMELQDASRRVIASEYTDIFLPTFKKDRMEVVKESQKAAEVLYKYYLTDDVWLFWKKDLHDNISSMFCTEEFSVEEFRDKLSEGVWNHYGKHVRLRSEDDNLKLEPESFFPWDYEGAQGVRLIDRWKKFYKAGIARSVILHGPPGTGKSTLSRQIAKELDGTVLYVPFNIFFDVRVSTLTEIITTLNPSVLIVDDIDRLDLGWLNSLLSFFEDMAKEVPLLVVTTNHLNALPDAFKRPGRFDEIWKIDPPSDEVREKVIRYFANLEGLEISPDNIKKVSKICGDGKLPGSHIRELLRRVSVMGWEELEFSDTDLVFNLNKTEDENPSNTDQDFTSKSVNTSTSDVGSGSLLSSDEAICINHEDFEGTLLIDHKGVWELDEDGFLEIIEFFNRR